MNALAVDKLNYVEQLLALGLPACEHKVATALWGRGSYSSRDIAHRGSMVWPSMKTLAAKTSYSVRWVRAVVARMERAGLVRREPRFRESGSTDGGGMQMSSLLHLAPLARFYGAEQAADPPAQDAAAPSAVAQPAATAPTTPPPPVRAAAGRASRPNRFDGGVGGEAQRQATAPRVPPRTLSQELQAKVAARVARQATAAERAEILAALRDRAPFREVTRITWLASLEVAGWSTSDELVLVAPDELHGDYVRDTHLDQLRQWLVDDLGVADVALI